MGKLVEMLWDCPYCGTKGILGRNRDCPNCGKPRGDGIKFYMPNEIKYVDEEKAKTINRNPDWQCSFCHSLNNDSDMICKSCGATKKDSEKNYFDLQKEQESKEKEKQELEKQQFEEFTNAKIDADKAKIKSEQDYYNYLKSSEDSVKEINNDYQKMSKDINDSFALDKELMSGNPKENIDKIKQHVHEYDNEIKSSYFRGIPLDNRLKGFIAKLTIGLLVIAATIGLCASFSPHEENMIIQSFSWNNTIQIEELKTVRESDWNLPSGARLSHKAKEIHHYDQVLDHYETKTKTESREVQDGYETVVTGYKDLGNGYSEEITEQRPKYKTEYYEVEYKEPVYKNVPIYRTKYYYDIDKWIQTRSVKTNGTDKSPYWGETSLNNKEREGKRYSDYKITAINEDKETNSYSIPFDSWEKLEKNEKITVMVNFWGHILEIKDSKGNLLELKQ